MENSQEYEILSTNLQPFFWKKVRNIIRQNKKSALQEFLFPNPNIQVRVLLWMQRWMQRFKLFKSFRSYPTSL